LSYGFSREHTLTDRAELFLHVVEFVGGLSELRLRLRFVVLYLNDALLQNQNFFHLLQTSQASANTSVQMCPFLLSLFL